MRGESSPGASRFVVIPRSHVRGAGQVLHKPWMLLPVQVGSARLRCSFGNGLTVMCLFFFFLFFQELTLKLGP